MNKIILLLLVLVLSFNISIAAKSHKSKLSKSGIKFQDGDLVNTKDGVIKGTVVDTHRVFYGIPFASAPVGELRFADPQPVKPWSYIKDCTRQKEQCVQICELGDGACSHVGTSEDCLYLDVFIPRDLDVAQPVEVMVFVPGGAFTSGTGACPLYDATMFANSSIIVVNVNYRLGVLGFMGTDILSGNFGFLDQVRALEWVHENIEAFGGNKNKVTLYGQSAGAFSVAAHLVSDLSKELFHRAILGSTPLTVGLKTPSVARGFAKRYSKKVGCSIEDIDCHRSKTVKEILDAQVKVALTIGDKILDAFTIWSPVVDGVIINGQPLTEIQNGRSHDVPTIIGDLKNEAHLFVYYMFKKPVIPLTYKAMVRVLFGIINGNKVIAKYPSPGLLKDCRPILSDLLTDYLFRCSGRYHLNKLVEFHDSPVFHYHYQHISEAEQMSEICEGLACHGAELSMVFNTYESGLGNQLEDDEVKLAQDLNNYWVNFVKSGNPNTGLTIPVTWEPVTVSNNVSLVIQVPIVSKDITSLDAKCDLFDSLTYRGYTKVSPKSRQSKLNQI